MDEIGGNMKILLIANSFGVNLQRYSTEIAKANGKALDIYTLYIGGCSLATHHENIDGNKKIYELFVNGETTNSFISILDALKMDSWDYVSLQQASHESGRLDTYYPHFEFVYNFVKTNCPNAKIMFHKTWPYSPINTYKYDEVPSWEPNFKFENAKQMNKAIEECYKDISSKFNIDLLVDSGEIAYKATSDIGDCYDDQGFHMNLMGQYLIGLNFVKQLYHKQIDNVFVPMYLGKDTCKKCVDYINNL